MKKTYLPVAVVAAGVLAVGIVIPQLSATQAAPSTAAPALPATTSAPAALADIFSADMNLDELAYPQGVSAPSLVDLVPEAAGVESKDIRVYDGGASVVFRAAPGSGDDFQAVAAQSGDGQKDRPEVQVDKGDLAIMRALHWQCAWVREYVDAANAGNEAAQKTAADQLATFPNLAAVRDYGPDLAGIQEDVITPMVSGDTAAGENWLAKSCGGIFPK
ncbi:MAG: hypothetical protein Q4B12_05420 [Bowdeniella nasicola]|nr:hypothetical protein [Bowdeniella nasicola]